MERKTIIYPNRFSPVEKRVHVVMCLIGILFVSIVPCLLMVQKFGGFVIAFKNCWWCIAILLSLMFIYREKRVPIIISSKGMRCGSLYKWSNIRSIRKVNIKEEDYLIPALLIEVKNKATGIVLDKCLDNVNVISPMKAAYTKLIWIDYLPEHKIKEMMTLIKQHTTVYPEINKGIELKTRSED